MIVCGPTPTRTELKAAERRRSFHKAIAAKAAELADKKIAEMLERANARARALQPEAMPAEPDPPPALVCPHCNAAKPIEVKPKAYPPVADIQRVVAQYYGLSRAELFSERRTKGIVLPRQVAMYIAKELTPFSLPAIGRYFGGRDHTTILHAVRKITGRVFADENFALEVASLMGELA